MFYMFGIKGFSYLLPVVNLIYLVKIIDIDNYGIIVLSQSIGVYFQVLCQFGFAYSGTKAIAESNNKINHSAIFSEIFTLNIILAFLGIIVLATITSSVSRFNDISHVLIPTVLSSIILGITPNWYFLGIQNTKYLSVSNIISKILLTLCIIYFIRSKEDYIYFPVFLLLSNLIPLVYSIYCIIYINKILFYIPKNSKVIKNLKHSFNFFISSMCSNAVYSNVYFIMDHFYSGSVIGIYGISERLIRALIGFIQPIGQAVFPFLASQAKENKSSHEFSKKIANYVAGAMIILSLIALFASNFVHALPFEFADKMKPSIPFFKMLLILLPTEAYISLYGSVVLTLTNRAKDYKKIYIIGFLTNIAVGYFLIQYFGINGACITIIFTQIIILALMHFTIKFLPKKQAS
ncbi:MAG: oligosaccharide flippase family protein [Bacteroidota bacterium]